MDKKEPDPYDRLRLNTLKAAGLAVVAGAGIPYIASKLPIEPPREPGQGEVGYHSTLQTGRLRCDAFVTEHWPGYWENVGQDILREVREHDFVIPEYFPEEYKELEKHPIIGERVAEYREINILFNKLSDALLAENKKVLVVDPAYNEEFGKLRVCLEAIESTPNILTMGLNWNMIMEILGDKKISRRSFLKGGSSMAISPVLLNLLSQKTYETENDLRRVYVAKHLTDAGNILDNEMKGLMIYPGTHYHKIEYYMKNPEEMEKRYTAYSSLVNFLGLKTLDKLRVWRPVAGQWKLIEQTG